MVPQGGAGGVLDRGLGDEGPGAPAPAAPVPTDHRPDACPAAGSVPSSGREAKERISTAPTPRLFTRALSSLQGSQPRPGPAPSAPANPRAPATLTSNAEPLGPGPTPPPPLAVPACGHLLTPPASLRSPPAPPLQVLEGADPAPGGQRAPRQCPFPGSPLLEAAPSLASSPRAEPGSPAGRGLWPQPCPGSPSHPPDPRLLI